MRDSGDILQAALGFFQLNMYQDAWDELGNLAPNLRVQDAVLELRIAIFNRLEKWNSSRLLAESLAIRSPENPQWWLSWAYAVRRESTVEDAKQVLTTAAEIHPNVALITYNLACYACVLGELDDACALLRRAFVLDNDLRRTAIDDPDLNRIYGVALPDSPGDV